MLAMFRSLLFRKCIHCGLRIGDTPFTKGFHLQRGGTEGFVTSLQRFLTRLKSHEKPWPIVSTTIWVHYGPRYSYPSHQLAPPAFILHHYQSLKRNCRQHKLLLMIIYMSSSVHFCYFVISINNSIKSLHTMSLASSTSIGTLCSNDMILHHLQRQ